MSKQVDQSACLVLGGVVSPRCSCVGSVLLSSSNHIVFPSPATSCLLPSPSVFSTPCSAACLPGVVRDTNTGSRQRPDASPFFIKWGALHDTGALSPSAQSMSPGPSACESDPVNTPPPHVLPDPASRLGPAQPAGWALQTLPCAFRLALALGSQQPGPGKPYPTLYAWPRSGSGHAIRKKEAWIDLSEDGQLRNPNQPCQR